jgi:hypothetical protein
VSGHSGATRSSAVITGPQMRGTGGTLIWVGKVTKTVATRPLGSGGRRLVGDVYNAAPLAICIATPDGYASRMNLYKRPI